jgi:hypothetical protein
VSGQVARALAFLAGLGRHALHPVEREGPGEHAEANVVAEANAGRKSGGSAGHRCCRPGDTRAPTVAPLDPEMNSVALSLDLSVWLDVSDDAIVHVEEVEGRESVLQPVMA